MIYLVESKGITDNLILCSLISNYRTDFKIMTHETLMFLPQLSKYILPVDFSENKKQTIKNNIETAKQAKKKGDVLIQKQIVIIMSYK